MTPRPLFLIATACIAPLFWTGQVLLGYFVSAQGCYPGDAPRPGISTPALQTAIWTFDAVALAAALAGGAISLLSWVRLNRQPAQEHVVSTGEGRAHFLAIWGLYSSLWFFCAILFNAIATFMVTPCAT
jgi:hypothetical protein